MGTDIHGWVECRTWRDGLDYDATAWCRAISLSMLGMPRDYDGFACLFGVRDFQAMWRPVAANRGLPPDTSPEVHAEHATWAASAFAETWLTWPEARAVDWTEPAIPLTTHITRYHRAPDGTLRLIHHHDWSRAFARASGINTLTTSPTDLADDYPEGTEWTTGTTLYRAERACRRDAVPEDGPWAPVWAAMETLAGVHGDENVRLVAWFDE
ncbi:hypothetical protein EDD90_6674 [Streptomyces sp. Ag109_O5-1]|uniref:hypothetical protein n=1 Tax=Streptomyces sp. Ag109_O5-1 TaxID=1938851 RepID=UPI000F50D588|nr:hypothetical protein [Streptomyces sp. Ag109_O5-1]RPE43471.1 hypothetical protein EDD90_6674 [Streptomyces sp. Ag109_O5-1]